MHHWPCMGVLLRIRERRPRQLPRRLHFNAVWTWSFKGPMLWGMRISPWPLLIKRKKKKKKKKKSSLWGLEFSTVVAKKNGAFFRRCSVQNRLVARRDWGFQRSAPRSHLRRCAEPHHRPGPLSSRRPEDLRGGGA